jgi:large exoprotein involved in heme utilization and adhesion
LNRVIGQNPSALLGRLDANGQVFIVNPRGVLFGAGSTVNVGGLIASTLQISNRDFLHGRYAFHKDGDGGAVVNQGAIAAAPGGYVALIGRRAANDGSIRTPGGYAAIAAGSRVTVTLGDHQMVGLSVEQGVLDALASNRGLIEADGGQALLAARGRDALLAGVVNNSGVIVAHSAVSQNGVIRLVADCGTALVGGVLDASAPNGGDGGIIETSGSRVKIAPDAVLSTAAPQGTTGVWLIAARDVNVGNGQGRADVTGAALSRALGTTNVAIGSADPSAMNPGTIAINDAVTWNTSNALVLVAGDGIRVNAPVSAPGGVVLFGTRSTVTQTAPIAAAGVALDGSRGQYRLDNASNRIGIVAANAGSVTLVDSVPLTVGAVGTVSGITATGPVTLHAPTITLDPPIVSTATGTAVTLVADAGFVNLIGPNAISTPNGRWLVFSSDPDADTFGGLQSGNLALWGVAPSSGSAVPAAASGNRFVFAVQQQAELTVSPDIAKTAGMTRVLGPEDVSLSLRYTGASYGNAFTDSPTTHEPFTFTVTSAGTGPDAAPGIYTITVTPGSALPAGYRVVTSGGTLRVAGTTTQPVAPVGPVPPLPVTPETPETPATPIAPVLAAPAVIDAVQTVAAETADDSGRTALALPTGLARPATPVVQTTSDPASDGSRLPDDAWPGNVCRM